MSIIRSSRASRRTGSARRRRGAIVVMFAVFLMLLMMFVAIAADFGRVYVARNALQTAADAGAMAGAIHLMTNKDETEVTDTTKVYAALNKLFTETIASDSVVVEIGKWHDDTRVFETGVAMDEADAVRSTVRKYVGFSFARLFGIEGRVASATAIGWSGADVAGSSDCLKPWTIPLKYLKTAILGQAGYDADPNKHILTHSDVLKLEQMMAADDPALHFTLKQGTGSPDDNSGNFYSVAMPPVCTVSDHECEGDPENGNRAVTDDIRACSNAPLAIGDVLMTQPGEAAQPTIDAIEDFCESQGSGRTCTGQEIKASFFTELTSETQSWTSAAGFNGADHTPAGRFPVEISTMGSFVITTVQKEQEPKVCTGSGKTQVCTDPQPKATITGKFIRKDDPGQVGPIASALKKTILVR